MPLFSFLLFLVFFVFSFYVLLFFLGVFRFLNCFFCFPGLSASFLSVLYSSLFALIFLVVFYVAPKLCEIVQLYFMWESYFCTAIYCFLVSSFLVAVALPG